MFHTFFRLFLPASISVVCILATDHWYKNVAKRENSQIARGESIGFLKSSKNSIEKRSVDRFIWGKIVTGNELFEGDAIRTGKTGTGVVTLTDTGADIIIDPDSVVVLKIAKGRLNLDLRGGAIRFRTRGIKRAFKGKQRGKMPVFLVNGKELEVTEAAEMNLSMIDGRANIEMIKGKANVKGKKKFNLAKGDSGLLLGEGLSENRTINVISPGPNDVFDIGDDGRKKTKFKWRFGENLGRIELVIGQSRRELKPVPTVENSDHLLASVPAGSFFWQLLGFRGGIVLT